MRLWTCENRHDQCATTTGGSCQRRLTDEQWEYLLRLNALAVTLTVDVPEPRYDVGMVLDRLATFYGLDAERYAREHADRLNREADR